MTRKEFLLALPGAAVLPAALSRNALAADAPKAAPAIAAKAPKSPPKPMTLPPIQPGPTYLMAGPQLGHVGHDEARIWVRATADASWKVIVTEVEARNPREVEGPKLTGASAGSGIAVVKGLKPKTRYSYQVVLDGREQVARPLPTFVTAAPPMEAGRMRVAFGSCVGQTVASAAPSWAELAARKEWAATDGGFDLLLMLGDNHYANTADLEKHRVYYTAHRLSAGWRDLTARTPIYAIWDDHDFGDNDSDGSQPGKENSLVAFKEFWGNPSFGEADNPGCYYTFTRNRVQFFMLDCRYYRSPDKMKDGPDKTMLGRKQMEWLKKELLASKAPIKVLATGSEWESFSSGDSWSVYKHERDLFLDWLKERKIEGVIFLSGDRHFASAYHVTDRFLEMSGGPFGSDNAKMRENQERFAGYDQGRLWCVLDFDTTTATPKVAGEFWQAGKGLLERIEFTWDQLNGRQKMTVSPNYKISG
jgi:alkaline phosphatase D